MKAAELRLAYASAKESRPRPVTVARQEAAAVCNAFTVDVEDYFQVEAFKTVVDRECWDAMASRVEHSTAGILDLLSQAGVKGTFFVLGWIAERHPDLVRKIHADGHEVASHGYGHERAQAQSPDQFRNDIRKAKQLLEQICGARVRGYRAPTFSIARDNWWAYDILADEGFDYSSSVYPISHDLYGSPDAPTVPFRPADSHILEIPLSTVALGKRNFPCSGGGYFRLLPYPVSRWCMARSCDQRDAPIVFYCHPWEFDEGQPRIRAGFKASFRHYTNISRMKDRVSMLLDDFRWGRMDEAFSRQLDRTAA